MKIKISVAGRTLLLADVVSLTRIEAARGYVTMPLPAGGKMLVTVDLDKGDQLVHGLAPFEGTTLALAVEVPATLPTDGMDE